MSYAFKSVSASFADSYKQAIASNSDRNFVSVHSVRGDLTQKSFSEFDLDVRRVQKFILQLGFKPKQVVTLAANEYEHLVYIVASWLLGISHCPINPQETPERVRDKIQALGGRSLVFYSKLVAEASAYATAPDFYPLVIPSLDAAADLYSSLFSGPMTLIFTSGTTGYSKIVPQDEISIMANVDCLIQRHSINSKTVICTPLPVFHVNALHFSFLACLLTGSKLVLLESFLLPQAWQIIEAEKVQILSVVPQIIQHMVKSFDSSQKYDVSSLKYLVSAAAPLSSSLANEFYNIFGLKIIQGFGLSEAVNFSCLIPVDISEANYKKFVLEARFPSIGTALECNEVTLLEGQIVLSGINVMQGYTNEGDVKSVVNGKFATGDLGYFETDEQGQNYFFISGRIKDVIKRNGMTVSLREIDEVISLYTADLFDAVTVPIDHQNLGEDLGVAVKYEGDNRENFETDFKKYLDSKLPPHMRPSLIVFTAGSLRTPSGKPLRWQLKSLFTEFKSASSASTIYVDSLSWQSIEKVFRTIFRNQKIQLKAEMSSLDIEGWDSLTHLEIIMALESEFKIQFKPQEVLSFKNVGELYELIIKKTKGAEL